MRSSSGLGIGGSISWIVVAFRLRRVSVGSHCVIVYRTCFATKDMLIPFHVVPVFHVIKFTKRGHSGESEISDSVHAWPEVVDLRTRTTPARFDTVIIHQDSPQDQGNKGTSNDLFSKLEV